ncbi:hypothetical protein ACFY8W_23110 [Streptomyces sp. NPDC012637]|uniref:hypothetical protein n=1 Tax=Streptomyces sp. NPDC012637 TaxID=3364842 RepID=UPI0036EBEE3E
MLAATACSSGDSGSQVEGMCGQPADSAAGKSLREVLGTDDFRTDVLKSDDSFVKEFTKDLKEWTGHAGNSTSPSFLCRYKPEDGKGHALLGFAWSPAGTPSEQRAQGETFYDVNAATGSVSDGGASLYVKCDLGGELSGQAGRAVLRADVNLPVKGEKPDEAAKTQQLSFLYLMTREVTEGLGCRNKPLAKDPVVKPRTESAP